MPRARPSTQVGALYADLYNERYWHQREFDTVERLKSVASDIGEPLSTLSIAWVLANPTITSAILGASRPDQLTDTLAAVNLKLDTTVKATLDDMTHEYRYGDAAK